MQGGFFCNLEFSIVIRCRLSLQLVVSTCIRKLARAKLTGMVERASERARFSQQQISRRLRTLTTDKYEVLNPENMACQARIPAVQHEPKSCVPPLGPIALSDEHGAVSPSGPLSVVGEKGKGRECHVRS